MREPSTVAPSTQFFFFKLPELSSIRIIRHPGFAFMLIMHPVFFNIMAGSTFSSFFKNWTSIKIPDLRYMQGWIKIFMNVATLTILADYFIGFSWAKFAFKCLFNFNRWTSRHGNKKQNTKKNPCYKNFSFPRKIISKRTYDFLHIIHKTYNQELLPSPSIKLGVALDGLETDFSVIFKNFCGITLRKMAFSQKSAQPRWPLIIGL